MQMKRLSSGRLRAAGYDEAEKSLQIEFADGSVKIFQAVPAEVYRRLLSSPNPATYFDDRIVEEYPVKTGSATGKADARSKLDSLFGKGS